MRMATVLTMCAVGVMALGGIALAAVDKAVVDECTTGWPNASMQAANDMIAKYGLPDGATPGMLVWDSRGPWLQIIVYKEEVPHNFPMPHTDVLEQVIAYNVPADKFDDLAEYDGSVIAERTKGTLAARCDKEDANFLALNLAVDIIQGRKTIEQARTTYAESIKAFMAGQKPEYMTALRFEIPASLSAARDPDEAVIQ